MGQPFNAEQHQAMVMQVVEGAEPNTVVNVFQKGYMLNGRLLRPAMVVVAKAAEKPSERLMSRLEHNKTAPISAITFTFFKQIQVWSIQWLK